jgi:hypothetical protein
MVGQPREPGPGSGPLDGARPDPSRLRISDEDRHTVAEVLREAAGDGRIDLEELDQRLEATYRAKTYGELVPITLDLPATGGPHPRPALPPMPPPMPRPIPGVPAPTGARHSSSIAVMSETSRVGGWVVDDRHSAFALMGSITLDLREAHFGGGEITIYANAVMGEVRVIVGAGTTVAVEGVGVMGQFDEQRAQVPFDPAQGGPVVHLRGLALMGSVYVVRKGPPGEEIRKRLGR